MSYTKGPWVAECIGVSDAGPNGVDVYEVITADGHVRIVDSAGEANARLIAAAPDLLEALQKCIDFSESATAVEEIAREAIAKATT